MEMIIAAVEKLRRKDSIEKGYDRLISYIANEIGVPGVMTEAMTVNELNWLKLNFDINLLKSETRDFLTESLEQTNLITPVLRYRFNKLIEEKIDEINAIEQELPMVLFLPRQASRLMVETFNMVEDSCIYIVIEPDLLQYRISLINKALFNIPSVHLNVDDTVHSIELDSYNWVYLDNWNGVPEDKVV